MIKLEILTLILLISGFGIKKKNILTVLLSLEIYRLIIILLSLILGVEIFFGMMLVCIGACEGVVGLRTLISNTRLKNAHGTGVY